MVSVESTAGELLTLAITAEVKAGTLYNGLKHLFAHHDQVALFWKGMQADEARHRAELEDIQSQLTAEQLQQPIEPNIVWKARQILHFDVEHMLSEVKTLDDAYEFAHEFESSEINAVFAFIMNRFLTVPERKAFMISELRDHQHKLVVFRDTFGDTEWRKSITAQE